LIVVLVLGLLRLLPLQIFHLRQWGFLAVRKVLLALLFVVGVHPKH
jgi:hypothetical protein